MILLKINWNTNLSYANMFNISWSYEITFNNLGEMILILLFVIALKI